MPTCEARTHHYTFFLKTASFFAAIIAAACCIEAIRHHPVKQLLLSWHSVMGSFGLPWKLPLLMIFAQCCHPLTVIPSISLPLALFKSREAEVLKRWQRLRAETDTPSALRGKCFPIEFLRDAIGAGGTFRFHFCHCDCAYLIFAVLVLSFKIEGSTESSENLLTSSPKIQSQFGWRKGLEGGDARREDGGWNQELL